MPSNTRILAASGGLLTGSDKGRELTSVAMDRGTMFWLWWGHEKLERAPLLGLAMYGVLKTEF